MADDIVTRLRQQTCCDNSKFWLLHEAANEIERLRADRDKWRNIADELYLSGNCSETCVDGAGGRDCSCLWGGAVWEYNKAVRSD